MSPECLHVNQMPCAISPSMFSLKVVLEVATVDMEPDGCIQVSKVMSLVDGDGYFYGWKCAIDRIGLAQGFWWKSVASLSASTFNLASAERAVWVFVSSWWLLSIPIFLVVLILCEGWR